MLIQIFKSVLLMSAVGGALGVFLLCVKPLTKKLFSPKWQYYIWLTVLIVMVLPVRFGLPKNTTVIPEIMTEQVQNMPAEIEAPADNQNAVAEPPKQSEKYSVPKINLPQNIWKYLSAVWLFVTAVILLARITKYYLFLRTIRKHSSKDTSLAGIPKRLEVRRTDMLDAPLIIGLIKPVMYLPDTELTEDNLNYILMHELTHYRCHDLMYKWAALIIKSVHWFNPLVYLVSKQIDLDCEVSCDFEVTSNLTRDEQSKYMNMILGMLANSGSQLRPLTTQMASGKKTLKRRFEMIRNKKKTSKLVSALSAVTAAVTLGTTVFASGVLADGVLNENMSSWARDDIQKAEEYSIIYDEMNIKDYTQNITRERFCDLAANVLVNSNITLTSWEYPFTDVHEYGGAITSLYCMGIIAGKSETEFKPKDLITREEAATALYRMYRYVGAREYYSNDGAEKYKFADDGDISDWAKDAVYGMQLTHIINGMGNDMFSPKSNFTTEQAVVSMVRLYEMFNGELNLTVIDNNDIRRNVRLFFSAFAQKNYELMKTYCTQSCIDGFFGDGYCFGMIEARLEDLEINPATLSGNTVNGTAVWVSVNMTPHENSVFEPAQTSASFYMILQKQSNGEYLIDEFATGL